MYRIVTKVKTGPVLRLALICVTVAGLLISMTDANSKTGSSADEAAYVDSVYSWGSWELGLQPAPGPQTPGSGAMNDRSRQLQFRPNDNATYMVQSVPIPSATAIPQPPLPSNPVSTPVPVPVIGPSGSGPILPGMVPNSPNLR